MLNCIAVGLGGFLGSVCRYLAGQIPLGRDWGFPVRTLAINLIGSFLIGAVTALALKRAAPDPRLVLFLKAGVCGGAGLAHHRHELALSDGQGDAVQGPYLALPPFAIDLIDVPQLY